LRQKLHVGSSNFTFFNKPCTWLEMKNHLLLIFLLGKNLTF